MDVRVTSRGFEAARKSVSAVASRARSLGPAMQVIAAAIDTAIDDSFALQSSPDGTPWAPLSGVTVYRRIARKRSKGSTTYTARRVMSRSGRLTARAQKMLADGATKALIDSGRLRKSAFTRVSGNSVKFGAASVYAGAQHFGNPRNKFGRNRAPLPARPYLPVVRVGGRVAMMRGGRAGILWAYARRVLERYVIFGSVS